VELIGTIAKLAAEVKIYDGALAVINESLKKLELGLYRFDDYP